jgi:hypothetical protein
VTQKSTGVKAEGMFITSVIDGDNLPSIALQFKGESYYHVIHDRMNSTDRQNYETLLKSFDEPFTAVNALLKVIQDKGEELKAHFESIREQNPKMLVTSANKIRRYLCGIAANLIVDD